MSTTHTGGSAAAEPAAELEPLEPRPALGPRRRAAVQGDGSLERGPLRRDRARVVARVGLLLVGRIVLLVDADEAEPAPARRPPSGRRRRRAPRRRRSARARHAARRRPSPEWSTATRRRSARGSGRASAASARSRERARSRRGRGRASRRTPAGTPPSCRCPCAVEQEVRLRPRPLRPDPLERCPLRRGQLGRLGLAAERVVALGGASARRGGRARAARPARAPGRASSRSSPPSTGRGRRAPVAARPGLPAGDRVDPVGRLVLERDDDAAALGGPEAHRTGPRPSRSPPPPRT